jgi:hypothetical protein
VIVPGVYVVLMNDNPAGVASRSRGPVHTERESVQATACASVSEILSSLNALPSIYNASVHNYNYYFDIHTCGEEQLIP